MGGKRKEKNEGGKRTEKKFVSESGGLGGMEWVAVAAVVAAWGRT